MSTEPGENEFSNLGNDLEFLLDAITDYGIVRLDVNGNVTHWGGGAQSMLGYTAVEVLGKLPKITPLTSRVWVTPVLGLLKPAIEEVPLTLQAAEIDAAFWVLWEDVLKPGSFTNEKFKWKNHEVVTPVFEVEKSKIWGLTGFMLKNFLDRMQSSDMSPV